MGTLLATGGLEALAVLAVGAGAALLLVAEVLDIVAVLLVAGEEGGWYGLEHRVLTPSKTSAGQCKAYNSRSKAAMYSSCDNVPLVGVLKCMTL